MNIGVDLVHIPRFAARIREHPEILEKLFLPCEEIEQLNINSIAGRFALKEAVMKALKRQVTDWHEIVILATEKGDVDIILRSPFFLNTAMHASISHDGDYVIAMVFVTAT